MSSLNFVQIVVRYLIYRKQKISLAALDGLHYSVGSFSLLHHALVSPLNIILLELNGVNRDKKSRQKIKKAARMIHEIIDGVLKRNQTNQVFSLHQSVQTIVSMYNSSYSGAIIFKSTLQGESLVGSKFLLDEVVRCLVTNACESYQSTAEHALVFVKIFKKDHMYVLQVSDFGKGMNFFERLIAPIQGITFKKHGTGIGLYLARFIITQMFDGQFHIKSYPGLGTSVVCKIPIINRTVETL